MAFGDSDPITGAVAPVFTRSVPGAAGIEHPVLTGTGHFLQEDFGDRLAAEIIAFIAARPARPAHPGIRRIRRVRRVRRGKARFQFLKSGFPGNRVRGNYEFR